MSQNSDQILEFFCPKCNQRLRAASRLAGQRLVCPKCEQSVKVPGIAASKNDDANWLDLEAPAPPVAPVVNNSSTISLDEDIFSVEPPSPKEAAPTPKSSASKSPAAKPIPQPSSATDSAVPKIAPDTASAPTPKSTSKADTSPTLAPPSIPPDDDDLPTLAPVTPSSSGSDFASDLFASIRLEDLPPPTAASTGRKPSSSDAMEAKTETHDAEYRITCRTCGTPQYVPLRKQGKSIRCPDCHSEFVIPPPPPNWNPKAKTSKAAGKQVDHEVTLAADTGPAPEMPEPTRKSAHEYLSNAEQATLDEQMDKMYVTSDFDSQEFMQKNFAIFRDVSVWFYTFALGMLTGIAMAVFLTLHSSFGEKVPAIAIDIGGLIVGIVVVSVHFFFGYALVDAGAHHRTSARYWPLGSLGQVLGDGKPVLVASFLSAAPGLALGTLILLAGLSTVIATIPVFLSFCGLFPIVLLSMLNNQSISTPFSQKVIASINLAKEEWGAAYFKIGIVAFIAFLTLSVGLTNPFLAVIAGFALPLAFFYACYQTGLLGSTVAQYLDVDIGQSEGDSSASDALPA